MGWKEKAERIKRSLDKSKEIAATTVLQVRKDAELYASSAAAGGVRGHFVGSGKDYSIGGDKKTGRKGIAPELVVSLPLKALAFAASMAGKGSTREAAGDLHAIGNGPVTFLIGLKTMEWAKTRRAASSDKTNPAGGALPDADTRFNAAEHAAAELRRRMAEREAAKKESK